MLTEFVVPLVLFCFCFVALSTGLLLKGKGLSGGCQNKKELLDRVEALTGKRPPITCACEAMGRAKGSCALPSESSVSVFLEHEDQLPAN